MQVEWHRDGLLFTADVLEEDWGEEGKNYEVENITAELDFDLNDDAYVKEFMEIWDAPALASGLPHLVERFRDIIKEEAIEHYQKVNR